MQKAPQNATPLCFLRLVEGPLSAGAMESAGAFERLVLAQCFDPCGQAGDLTRSSVLVVNALGNATHQFRLSSAHSCGCCFFIAGCDGFFSFTQEGADARTTGFVDGKALFVLTGALFAWGELAMV